MRKLVVLNIVGGLALATSIGLIARAQGENKEVVERVSRSEALQLLDQEEQELFSQRDLERTRAMETLPSLPFGAQYEPATDSIDGIDDLRNEVESAADSMEHLPPDVWYEPGYFETQLANSWQCSWLSAAVAAVESGDTEGRDRAIAQLESFRSSVYYQSFPDFERFFNITAEPVTRGALTEARGFLQSCPSESRVDAKR